jgi:flotillin
MSTLKETLGVVFIPGTILMLAVVMLLTVKFIASRYKKVPPNKVGVFYGRKYKTPDGREVGYKLLTGGGRILMPLVENYEEMSTAVFQVDINEDDIPNKDNVKLTVRGVATCRLSSDPIDLGKAAEAFLGKGQPEIAGIVLKIMKGHLRSIVGKMTIDEILRERESFNKQVFGESQPELKHLGIDVVNLALQDINDKEGYIDSLGKRAVAQAKSEADIDVSNAQFNAAKVKAENEAKTAEADKDRDVKKAEFKTAAAKKTAEADAALGIEAANQEKTLKVAIAGRDAAEREAQIKVAQQEALRQKQQAEVVAATAEAERRKTVIQAEAAKQKAILEAEAEAGANVARARAEKEAQELRGQGEASYKQALLEAQARGEAAQKKEALLAEAQGTEALAKALQSMDEKGRFIIILDKLPLLIDRGGDAAAKVAEAIFKSVAAPLGSIDRLEIIDVGGSGRGVDQVAGIVPSVVFQFLAKAKAQGLDFTQLLSKLGVNPEKAIELLGGVGKPDRDPTGSTGVAAPPA